MTASLPNVALAIATFRTDEHVLRILEGAHREGVHPFHSIVIVDSLPSGRIAEAIDARGYRGVVYRAFDRNLGAAGNLHERLRTAAEAGADYVYAMNADGTLDLDAVRALVRFAEEHPRAGAVYPARRYVRRGGSIDLAGARADVLGTLLGRTTETEMDASPRRVHWSSSNGALYATDPMKRGVAPWVGLWHGYEDLQYGWALEESGYEQWLLGSVVIDDDYEYREYRVGPLAFHASDKPAWSTYYQARNLILIARRHDRGELAALARIALELALVGVVRSEKRERLAHLVRGSIDGLRGTLGKWRLP